MWEMVQIKVSEGTWPEGQDQSDWFNHREMFDEGLSILQSSGITGGRLVIAPYEIIDSIGNYDWDPMDTAIEMMSDHGMKVDLAIGPFNTPYAPGVRLPRSQQNLLQNEASERGQTHVSIGGEDPNMPVSSRAIADFGKAWVEQIIKKFGKDERIDKLYFSNEWPDTQGVEGTSVTDHDDHESTRPITFSVSEDYMLTLLDQIEHSSNTKKIVLNTNIRPKENGRLHNELGALLSKLAELGHLGFDEYPTQYYDFFSNYEKEISVIRSTYPQTTLLFTELQAAPWPQDNLLGKSWVEIFNQDREMVIDYFERYFPKTLDSRVKASGITEVGLWGSEVWIVLKKLGYNYPVELLASTAHAMSRA